MANESQTNTDLPIVFDLTGAARYSGFKKWTLRELIWSGALATVKPPSIRSGRSLRKIYIARADLDRLVESYREVEVTP
jgi:hypothetical protein